MYFPNVKKIIRREVQKHLNKIYYIAVNFLHKKINTVSSFGPLLMFKEAE
jgi:hypothetical protein